MLYLLHKFVKEGMSDDAAWAKACAVWRYEGPKPVDKTRSYKKIMRLAASQATITSPQRPQQPGSQPLAVPVVRPKAIRPAPPPLLEQPLTAPSGPSGDSIAAAVKLKRQLEQEAATERERQLEEEAATESNLAAARDAATGVALDHQYFTTGDLGFLPVPASGAEGVAPGTESSASKRRKLIRFRVKGPTNRRGRSIDPENLYFLPTSLDDVPVTGPVVPAERDPTDDPADDPSLPEDLQ